MENQQGREECLKGNLGMAERGALTCISLFFQSTIGKIFIILVFFVFTDQLQRPHGTSLMFQGGMMSWCYCAGISYLLRVLEWTD